MFKKSIFCVCMFFVVSILIVNSAFALNLGFNPSTQTVTVGDSAIVDMEIITTGFGLLTGYDILIAYDPFILDIKNDNISVNLNLGGIAVDDFGVNVDPNSGTVYISWMSDYCSDEIIEQPPFLNLATLSFYASEVGTSDLPFLSVNLYDDFIYPSVSLNINNPDDIDDLAAITTPGEINVIARPQSVPDPAPEPSTFILLAISSLMGLGYFKRKKVL